MDSPFLQVVEQVVQLRDVMVVVVDSHLEILAPLEVLVRLVLVQQFILWHQRRTKPAFSFGNATATSNGTLGTTTAKTSGFTFGSIASEDSDPVEKLVKDGTSAKEAKHQDGASADAMQSEEHSTQAEENSDS